MKTNYDEWREAVLAGTYTPLDSAEIEAAFDWSAKHGPANCWTGTSGHSAAFIRKLLRDRLHLLSRLGELRQSMEGDLR